MALNYSETQDPKKAASQQRGLIYQRGQELAQQNEDQGNAEGQKRSQYEDWLNAILSEPALGNGGYNEQETRDIMGREGLNGLQQTDAERQANYLTPGEEAGIRGNTASYSRYFDPEGMNAQQGGSAALQRGAVSDYQSGVRGAVDKNALSQSGDYIRNAHNQIGATSDLLNNTLNSVGQNVRGTIDPTALRQSEASSRASQLTPEQQQEMVTAAGTTAGNRYRAAVGDLERKAAAAGSSPQGVAAYRARMEREGAGEAADAMTRARAGIAGQAADLARSSEQQRLGAEQSLAGLRSGTELQMGEDTLRTRQGLTDQALQQFNTEEAGRLGANQFSTQAQLQAENAAGQARIGTEQAINEQQRQQGQFNATAGAGIAQAADTANSSRAGAIAGNRQSAEQYNQGQRYGRGMDINQATSNRAQTVGNQRLGQQQYGLNYYQGQNQQANQNQQGAYGRQQQIYATQTGGTNQAAGLGVQASAQPGTFSKIIGGATGLLGAAGGIPGVKSLADGDIVTEPTLAVLGEDGPEAVTPLSYRATAKVRPSAAMPQPQMRKPRFYGEEAA